MLITYSEQIKINFLCIDVYMLEDAYSDIIVAQNVRLKRYEAWNKSSFADTGTGAWLPQC